MSSDVNAKFFNFKISPYFLQLTAFFNDPAQPNDCADLRVRRHNLQLQDLPFGRGVSGDRVDPVIRPMCEPVEMESMDGV